MAKATDLQADREDFRQGNDNRSARMKRLLRKRVTRKRRHEPWPE